MEHPFAKALRDHASLIGPHEPIRRTLDDVQRERAAFVGPPEPAPENKMGSGNRNCIEPDPKVLRAFIDQLDEAGDF